MMTLIRERNRDLMHAIRSEMATAPAGEPLIETLARAVERPAPRYYVSFDRAIRAVRETLADSGVPACGVRRRQWDEISSRTAQIARKHNLPLTAALARVLHEGKAGSFFLSASRALSIYHEAGRNHA